MFAVTTDKKMAVFHGGDMQRDTPNQQPPPDACASRVSLILVTRGLLDKPTGGVTNTMDKAPLGALLTDGLGGGDLNAQCWTLVDWRQVLAQITLYAPASTTMGAKESRAFWELGSVFSFSTFLLLEPWIKQLTLEAGGLRRALCRKTVTKYRKYHIKPHEKLLRFGPTLQKGVQVILSLSKRTRAVKHGGKMVHT